MNTLGTIVFYLTTFCISILICYSRQKWFEDFISKKEYHVADYVKLLLIISIIVLPLVLVAAYRGDTVGVDTSSYIRIYYENAGVLKNYWELYKFIGESPIFVRLVWDAYHIFKTPIFYMGMAQYITAGAIVVYGVLNAKKYPVWMALCVYCLWFFNDSLNATRQFIAIAIILVAYQLLVDKHEVKAICLFVVALGFHRSAILIIPCLLFLRLFRFENRTYKRNIVLGTVLIALLWGQKIFEFLISKGVLPERYGVYVNTFFYRNSRGINSWILTGVSKYALFEIFVRVILIIFYFVVFRHITRESRMEFYQYVCILLVDILIYSIGVYVYKTVYFIRLSAFFDFFVIHLIPLLEQKISISYKVLRVRILVVIYSLAYWGVHVVYYGSGATIPYLFRLE